MADEAQQKQETNQTTNHEANYAAEFARDFFEAGIVKLESEHSKLIVTFVAGGGNIGTSYLILNDNAITSF